MNKKFSGIKRLLSTSIFHESSSNDILHKRTDTEEKLFDRYCSTDTEEKLIAVDKNWYQKTVVDQYWARKDSDQPTLCKKAVVNRYFV